MRSHFEVESLDYDLYRLSILARQGFDVYLNGQRIVRYIWWKDKPHYRIIELKADQIKHLKKGTNTLAAYANVEYHRQTQKPVGQIDFYFEGLKLSDVQ